MFCDRAFPQALNIGTLVSHCSCAAFSWNYIYIKLFIFIVEWAILLHTSDHLAHSLVVIDQYNLEIETIQIN